MSDGAGPAILNLDENGLYSLLSQAFRNTAWLGLAAAVVLLISAGWRTAAMMLAGGLISAASLLEWKRLAHLINDRMQNRQRQRGTVLVVTFFLLRLLFFAGVIYVSLKCFRGSPIALVCGLGLAVATLSYEAVRLLRN
jgi:hypothetical protein